MGHTALSVGNIPAKSETSAVETVCHRDNFGKTIMSVPHSPLHRYSELIVRHV